MATGGPGSPWRDRLAAWLIRVVTRSTVNHAVLYLGDGQCIEGRPEGAGYVDASAYPGAIWSNLPLTDQQRAAIVAAGRSHKGAPYSWLDDLAIGLAKILGRALPPFVRDRLKRKDRLQCAQLVDLSYRQGGVELFHDHRYAGDVSPGDLLALIRQEIPAPVVAAE